MDQRQGLDPGLGLAQRVAHHARTVLAHLQVQEARDDLEIVADAVMDLVQQRIALLQGALQLGVQAALAVQLRAQLDQAVLERAEHARDRAALDATQRDQPVAVARNRRSVGADHERSALGAQGEPAGDRRAAGRSPAQEAHDRLGIAIGEVERGVPEQISGAPPEQPPGAVVRERDRRAPVEQQHGVGQHIQDALEDASSDRHHVLRLALQIGGRKILAPLGGQRFLGRLQVDHDAAAGVAPGDRLLQLDLGVAEVVGGDAAEHVRGHHAHRRPALDQLAERAGAVAEHDLLVVLRDDVEVALDATLEVDQDRGDLRPVEAADLQCCAVVAIDRGADRAADHADVAVGFLEPDHVLERAGELADQRAHEAVAVERHRDALEIIVKGRRHRLRTPCRPASNNSRAAGRFPGP